MNEVFYLLSGNIDPSRDTDNIHLDMLKSTNKENPSVVLFLTGSDGVDWHGNYRNNLTTIFSRYSCQLTFVENPDDPEIPKYLENADIIYFMGGSPYKHTRLNRYRDDMRKVKVKAGTSAGAIYMGYHTFYLTKDDYILAIPEMLGWVDLHVLPHSETHKEELVCNYLANEAGISFLKLFNQTALKIECNDSLETVTTLMGNSPGIEEKIELQLKNRMLWKINASQEIKSPLKLINNP